MHVLIDSHVTNYAASTSEFMIWGSRNSQLTGTGEEAAMRYSKVLY